MTTQTARPREHEYASYVAYTRALEDFCTGQAADIERLRTAMTTLLANPTERDALRKAAQMALELLDIQWQCTKMYSLEEVQEVADALRGVLK